MPSSQLLSVPFSRSGIQPAGLQDQREEFRAGDVFLVHLTAHCPALRIKRDCPEKKSALSPGSIISRVNLNRIFFLWSRVSHPRAARATRGKERGKKICKRRACCRNGDGEGRPVAKETYPTLASSTLLFFFLFKGGRLFQLAFFLFFPFQNSAKHVLDLLQTTLSVP